ncbi:Dam family site-specific DNA-(adenine-N6)-methyltransferase [Thalassotalea piscium]|uniref:Site-specific DNA-methyltransferase (adenine-specific) n=1 Tax=Thalassotalea piscium TaxID=1230533 RepID=A0A7X0TTJ4_9GAMM|nr:Dam family site-specific DNA-(adenine-N6)-methyltransferase [Thalassotalea piscium]MBB6543150.1 DNA adenine methylase [Thalassotalea piscium]
MNNNGNQRSFLKWAGSKYNIIENIKSALPPSKKLIECFAGSCSVFINTNYESYLINDLNEDLVNLFMCVKENPEVFVKEARVLFTSCNNNEKQYYELRNEFNQSPDSLRKSALFLYLNRHGYNGLCRYNQSGGFNVPFGRYIAPVFPEEALYYFALKSKKAKFTAEHFSRTFARARKGNVLFCDPPYAKYSETAKFTAYTKNGFSYKEQAQLASLAEKASQRGVGVIITNHDTVEMRELYHKADTIQSLKVQRSISCKGDNRGHANEIIVTYNAVKS